MNDRRKKVVMQVAGTPKDARIDKYITMHISGISRTKVSKLIQLGFVRVNREECRPSSRVSNGDVIEIEWPWPEPPPNAAEPIPLDIVYEDDDLLVVDKEPGMVVHPSRRHYAGTLYNALLYHGMQADPPFRPMIVHRIDRETSGLLVIPKHVTAYRGIRKQFVYHRFERVYRGIVTGAVKKAASEIDAPILDSRDNSERRVHPGGKKSVTCYRIVERFGHFTLLEFRLKTGRTHQIRVHTAYMGFPILGDGVYGQRHPLPEGMDLDTRNRLMNLVNRHMLHAMVLGFIHPVSGKLMTFKRKLPGDMKEVVAFLEKFDAMTGSSDL